MKNIKHYLSLYLLALLFQCAKAQNPYPTILYTDFNPDIKMVENYEDTVGLDIDQDGTSDVLVYFKHFGSVASRYGALKTTNSKWEIADCRGVDSISVPHPNVPTFGWSSIEGLMDPESHNYRYGIRFHDGVVYYYGWIKVVCEYNQATAHNEITIDKLAYCTIPNYPLLWGQTSINNSIEENEAFAFASLHPNPASGLVTITGKNLKQAEAVNILGQRVATAQGKGETLQVDITKLPAGVYFVNIIDAEGRKCVRKVVKE